MTALTWCSFRTIYAETETQQRPEEHSLVRNSREGLVFYRVRNVIASYHSYISRTRTSQPTFGISEDGLEEVCLGDWKDSSRATILWHSFFFFCQIEIECRIILRKLFGVRSQWLSYFSFLSFLSPWPENHPNILLYTLSLSKH